MLYKPGQTTTTCNIHKCCMKNLTSFKFEPTTPKLSQYVTTYHKRVVKCAQHVAHNNVASKLCNHFVGAI